MVNSLALVERPTGKCATEKECSPAVRGRSTAGKSAWSHCRTEIYEKMRERPRSWESDGTFVSFTLPAVMRKLIKDDNSKAVIEETRLFSSS